MYTDKCSQTCPKFDENLGISKGIQLYKGWHILALYIFKYFWQLMRNVLILLMKIPNTIYIWKETFDIQSAIRATFLIWIQKIMNV